MRHPVRGAGGLSLMTAWRQHTRHGLRFCSDCLMLLGCWALWLLLGGLLVVQVAVIVSKEFAVPGFVLRSVERQFAASGVQAHCGRATFDIAGGVLLENVQLSLPQFSEPVAEARAVFVQLDPWALLAGRLDPHVVHATGTKVFVPAMLAPTGRSEEILSDLECVVATDEPTLQIRYLNTRLAGMTVAVHGACERPRTAGDSVAPLPLLEQLARNYAPFCRQLIRTGEWLRKFEQPQLRATLTPAPGRGAIARVEFTAREFHDATLQAVAAHELRASARLPLFGDAAKAPADLSFDELTVAGMQAQHLRARLHGVLAPARFTYTTREVFLTADRLAARGFAVDQLAARVAPAPLPALTAELVARSLGSPLAVKGRADLAQQSAAFQVEGALAPQLLAPIGAQLRRDLRRFIAFGQPVALQADVTFQPGWKFARLTGHIAARDVDAYQVRLDSAGGDIDFDGRRFVAREAIARIGDNFARGSFEQDLKTREYRFLLEGRLRPLAISGWFREWWPNFFENFEFPLAPPAASVDVAGRWFAGRENTVFLFAESTSPVIRGAQLDYARTLMFIRPNFMDGLELFGIRGTGDLRATFTRTLETEHYAWKELAFALESTIDLETGTKLLGPTLGARFEPYRFERPPHLQAKGRFDGPAAASQHHELSITARSDGGFSVYGFPGRNLSFDATLHDDDLVLENISADVAGGILSGRAKLWGDEAQRRLGFDASLRGASLGETATAISRYLALRRGQTSPAATEAILTGQNSTQLDVSVSAEGIFQDPLSFQGSGNAALTGPELGKIRLLGLLSELLNFTSLRFTNAQTEFKVDGPQLTFRSANVTGANSAIEAHGAYSLRSGELDFNARVFPFQESKSLLQNVVGVMLLPFSAVLEVRLTGPLREPKWAFVIGPTNLLRFLAEPNAAAPATEPAPTDYLKRPTTPASRETH